MNDSESIWVRSEDESMLPVGLAYYRAGQALCCQYSGFQIESLSLDRGVVFPKGTPDLSDPMNLRHMLLVFLAGNVAYEIHTGERNDWDCLEIGRIDALRLSHYIDTGEWLPDWLHLDDFTEEEQQALWNKLEQIIKKRKQDLSDLEDMVRDKLLEDKDFLDLVASELLEREQLSGEELIALWQSS